MLALQHAYSVSAFVHVVGAGVICDDRMTGKILEETCCFSPPDVVASQLTPKAGSDSNILLHMVTHQWSNQQF